MLAPDAARPPPAVSGQGPQIVDRLGGAIDQTATTLVPELSTDDVPRSREWWARAAEATGTSWRALGELAMQAVANMQPCQTCVSTPCRNPSFCTSCREADRKRERRQQPDLPPGWDGMSIDVLWNALNDPRRRPPPQVTVDAIMVAVRARGVGALKEPETLARLKTCNAAAIAEIDRRLAKLGAKR